MENTSIISIQPLGFPWPTVDPFLFCAHHRDEFPQGNENMEPIDSLEGRTIGNDFTIKDGWRMYHGQKIPGFPFHPHRGFETVSIIKEGFVDHTDSLGASARFGEGDVQWMTAGKGVLHSEMFPLIYENQRNPTELFQVWLNLPKASKFVEPHFKMLWKEAIPVYKTQNESSKSVEINIIAGAIGELKAPEPTPDSWAANPTNEVRILTIKLESHTKWELPKVSSFVNRTLYFYRGTGFSINGTTIPTYHLAQVKPDENCILEAGNEDCFVLLLEGKPINEPVVQHGPFVMNTRQEIYEAFQDYQKTQFGGWPWPKQEQAHPRDKGRFAIHADGKEEIK